MVSDAHRLLFIHIPKSAGFSIRQVIKEELEGKYNVDTYPKYTRDKHPLPLGLRYTHMTLKEHLENMNQVQKAYRRFSFVRNPWDRLASNYEWRKWFHLPRYKFKSFTEMIDLLDGGGWEFEDDDERHTLTQSDFLKDKHAQLAMDRIGKFEDLVRDFESIKSEFNLPESLKLPISNRSTNKEFNDYRDYYSDRTKRIVAKLFEEDIDNFQYTF